MNLPNRLVFPLALIALGCLMILTPVLAHTYMAQKYQDRMFELAKTQYRPSTSDRESPFYGPWGSSSSHMTFMMAGMGSFGAGALLAAIGLWIAWLGRNEKPLPEASVNTTTAEYVR